MLHIRMNGGSYHEDVPVETELEVVNGGGHLATFYGLLLDYRKGDELSIDYKLYRVVSRMDRYVSLNRDNAIFTRTIKLKRLD